LGSELHGSPNLTEASSLHLVIIQWERRHNTLQIANFSRKNDVIYAISRLISMPAETQAFRRSLDNFAAFLNQQDQLLFACHPSSPNVSTTSRAARQSFTMSVS
jgi:hypothetical protein